MPLRRSLASGRLQEGLSGNRLCAAFVDEDCSFKDTITGIHAPRRDEDRLKALTAYLNSSLAAYQLFLTSGWGIDRRRVKKGEVFECLASEILENDSVVAALAKLVNEHDIGGASEDYNKRLDSLVFDAFDLSAGERVLVADMLRQISGYMNRDNLQSSVTPPPAEQLQRYATAFMSVLAGVLEPVGRSASAIVRDGESPLRVVSFRLLSGNSADNGQVEVHNGSSLHDVLTELDKRLLQQEGLNIYRRRHLRLFDRYTVHIVKPAEIRFWTESAAFNDADETVGQTLAGVARGAR